MADGMDVERGTQGALSEGTPLLARRCGGRSYLGPGGRLHPHTTQGPCFCTHAPPEPRDDQGRSPPRQLLRYNQSYASSILSLLQLRGTAFASWSIWLHVLGYVAVSAAVCAVVFFSCRRPELIRTSRLCELVAYSSSLLGFLLVMYLSFAVRRWWTLRVDTLGGLWSAVGNLVMLLSAHFPQPGSGELKSLVLRYCLASFELTFMQAQGTDGVLGGLVRQGLLTDDEKRKLEELVSKPQAMWVWIAGILQRLAERGKLSSRMLVMMYGICAEARAAVGRDQGAFAYLDTQLPFPYVHFLSVLVHLNNFALAVKCGVLSAVAIWNLQRSESKGPVSDTENLQVLVLQVLFVIWVPALFHAVLEEVSRLGEPFNDGFRDFPRQAYHIWMKTECEALQSAGEKLPQEALQVTEEFEVREGDLVHDCVALVEASHSLL